MELYIKEIIMRKKNIFFGIIFSSILISTFLVGFSAAEVDERMALESGDYVCENFGRTSNDKKNNEVRQKSRM